MQDFFNKEWVIEYLHHCRHTEPAEAASGLIEKARAFAGVGLHDNSAILAFKRGDTEMKERGDG